MVLRKLPGPLDASAIEQFDDCRTQHRVFIRLQHDLVADLGLYQILLILVDDAEVRVDAELVKMFADEPLAERVDRADVGGVEQEQLATKVRIAAFDIFIFEGFADTSFHFSGGGFGKCQHQHISHIGAGGAVGDNIDAAAGKHGRLAGAGRRGYQHITFSLADGLLLVRRPLWLLS